jgi:hypothetical protein
MRLDPDRAHDGRRRMRSEDRAIGIECWVLVAAQYSFLNSRSRFLGG